ncbi:hypothetical protein [Rhodovulum sulfidophilum]|uniref:tRNA pseudouridine synthase B n=1 Tax=Rhodovulum sulfidophilum TaxID=35806 RepID=A0ABS1RY78_RHOSU|nr:hypothetical protein [Rhodovulum sulfidophilum]MBL3610070.1 hypothetical protein [Rhodovulum sulfidophilum]MCE8455528.1 hypothetical protein [Rhodovulum sulfidophilum]
MVAILTIAPQIADRLATEAAAARIEANTARVAAKSSARDGKPLLARAAFARAERLQGRAVTLGALAAQARAGGAA